jgi:hypothetical protein
MNILAAGCMRGMFNNKERNKLRGIHPERGRRPKGKAFGASLFSQRTASPHRAGIVKIREGSKLQEFTP